MSRLNLLMHCGASAVDRQQVIDAPTPTPTDTWTPIPHSSLIELVENRLPDYGLTIQEQAHGLHADGSRYFGMFQVGTDGATADGSDFAMVIGLRNSHDKSFPAGLALGSGVFVCDNLCFSAEVVVGRRHTAHIMRDLPLLVSNAVGRLCDARTSQEDRLEAYKETEITDSQADHLVCEAFRKGAIGKTRIADVLEQWRTPAHPEFAEGKTAWRLFNGFTEVYKNSNRKSRALSVTNMTQKTTRLHGVIDSACGLLTDREAIADGVIDADAVTVTTR
jgi:hypothetical protein